MIAETNEINQIRQLKRNAEAAVERAAYRGAMNLMMDARGRAAAFGEVLEILGAVPREEGESNG